MTGALEQEIHQIVLSSIEEMTNKIEALNPKIKLGQFPEVGGELMTEFILGLIEGYIVRASILLYEKEEDELPKLDPKDFPGISLN